MPRVAKGIRPVGPPSKKTPEVVQRMIEVARTGLPLRFVAAAGGVTLQTLGDWRDNDKAFGMAIEQARTESVRERWEEIRRQGTATKNKAGNWAALAWQLERSFPEQFGKPETQLAVGLQINQQTNNTLVISAEAAEKLEKRAKVFETEAEELLAAHRTKFAALHEAEAPPPAASDTRIIEAEVAPEPIVLPPESERTPGWWRQFSRGDGLRPVSPEAARYVIKRVAREVLGMPRASGLQIDLGDEEPTLRDVHAAIAELCGPRGWEALVKLGEAQ